MEMTEANPIVPPSSERARAALDLVYELQASLAARLEAVSSRGNQDASRFQRVTWGRDGGAHGGGSRLQCRDTAAFDRASINVSGVHYDDRPDKRLACASALSTIVHPRVSAAPSMHTHISFTEMRDGRGYWRIMTDLNPSHPNEEDTGSYRDAIRAAFASAGATDALFEHATAQGDRYFYIPALERHRGVFHVYLEQHDSGDWSADYRLAETVGRAVIAAYGDRLEHRLGAAESEQGRRGQLDYHTLYFFQVLTLDRGTTSGLLVHDQNDVGILGSLPSHVDVDLLSSWVERVPSLQKPLVEALVAALDSNGRVLVTEDHKRALAGAVRTFYRANPDALALQARGDVIPPTVQNHR